MTEQDIESRLHAIESRLDEVQVSVEKTRKYILFMLIAAVVGFVLPLIGLAFAIPSYLSTLQGLSAF